MDTILYLLSNIFHIYSMFLFVKFAFDRENVGRIKELLFFASYYMINSAAFLFGHNWLLNMVSNILPFFGITFLYKSSILKKVAATLGINISAIICDTLVMTVQGLLGIHSPFFELGFVSNILFIAAMNFLLHFKRKDKERYSELPVLYYMSIIFVPLGSIVIGHFTAQSLDVVSAISAAIILLINADVFYLYDTLTEMFYKKQENELIQFQNKAYLNQIHIMQESQLKIRCLKHDMDNHLIKMQDLLEQQKYSELNNYLNGAKQSIDTDVGIIDSGNESVDSILNYKLTQIKSMNVDTEYEVSVPENLSISLFDINIVLGNLVDNAIEALKAVRADESKKLIIKINSKQGYFKIYIANTFDGIVTADGKSRKGDNINHGLGLKSVLKTVEKYGGMLKTDTNGKMFEISVIMYEK